MLSGRRSEFFNGIMDEAPILLGDIPFGILFGASAVASQIPVLAVQGMSLIVFAGSAQFVAVQLMSAGASGLVVLMVILVVNLRHVLYSASVAPYLQHLKPAWKILLSYLLTDEAYAVAVTHYHREGALPYKHWYFLGAGLMLWSTWQISTGIGILVGTQLSTSFPIRFFLPLTFIALVVPLLKDRSTLASALVAGAIGLATLDFPFKTGLLLAGLCGILTGLFVERRHP